MFVLQPFQKEAKRGFSLPAASPFRDPTQDVSEKRRLSEERLTARSVAGPEWLGRVAAIKKKLLSRAETPYLSCPDSA